MQSDCFFMAVNDKPALTEKAKKRAQEKEERLAKALRDNLRKRKAASQARQAPPVESNKNSE